jgi:hypothetical protein
MTLYIQTANEKKALIYNVISAKHHTENVNCTCKDYYHCPC